MPKGKKPNNKKTKARPPKRQRPTGLPPKQVAAKQNKRIQQKGGK